MADVARIKRNLAKMIDQGAPESDITAYLGSEGFDTPEAWQAASTPKTAEAGAGASLLPKDEAAGWFTTRLRNVATGAAGLPRALSDLYGRGLEAVGATPEEARAAQNLSLITSLGQASPSTEEMNKGVEQVMPAVNSPGRGGKILDAAVEAGLGAAVLPGAARNLLPAVSGGATSETAGQLTEGTPLEPVARIVGGVVPGALVAGAQNVTGNVVRGVRNVAPNAEQAAARVIGRNLTRDKMTAEGLAEAQKNLGPGAMPIEAAGPNVTGSFRGSTAAPGAARTTAQTAFDERLGGSNERTVAALDRGISPNRSLATTTEGLDAKRQAAARPLYEEAGIPERPETRIRAINEPPTPNSPIIRSEKVDALLSDSADVKTAIAAARKLPDYKNLPANSMIMLDKAYKHLEGLEQAAMRSGNRTRARDISNLRRDFRAALVEANPKYGRALAAYAGPSKMIDAGKRAQEWFAKNVDPEVVAREWKKMAPAERDAARIGIRDWARNTIGRADRGTAAERVWKGENNRERLEATVGFDRLKKDLEVERNLIAKQRETGVGSRTAPMLNEQADNALESAGIVADLVRGRVGSAATKFAGRGFERLSEGKSEATNALIAEWLTSADPAKIAMVNALLERTRLQELARSQGRRNALAVGGTAIPAANALVGSDTTR